MPGFTIRTRRKYSSEEKIRIGLVGLRSGTSIGALVREARKAENKADFIYN